MFKGAFLPNKTETRDVSEPGSWQGKLQTSTEDAFIYNVLKHLAHRDVSR